MKVKVINILTKQKVCKSKSEVRRLMLQGAIKVNGINIDDIECELDCEAGRHLMIVKGKKMISIVSG